MGGLSRRSFLAAGTIAAGAAVLGRGASPAAAAVPRDPRTTGPTYGDLRDIKHVIVLMQENRSFDHYFGSMRGVRGFGDRSTITLPGGYSVFQQPTSPMGEPVTASQYPWHLGDAPPSAYPAEHQPPSSAIGAQGYIGTPHSWYDQHEAWQGGLMNGWVAAKVRLTTLGYLTRDDIPFQYALADAYTVGDAYHCSAMSATGPNRTYLWSGSIDAQKAYSDFTAYDGGDERGKRLLWQTYAETLEVAGVDWKVYQCIDHFSDNGLEYFNNFAAYDITQHGTPAPGVILYDKGVATVPEPLTGTNANADNLIAAIRNDVVSGTLPHVSWVVPNQLFSEHPAGAPDNGAYLARGILEALNADPEVFNSTLVVVTYDENDGQFDHVPPPIAPPRTTDEWCRAKQSSDDFSGYAPVGRLPVGLGFRVPLILVSPWTRGGWVTSEVSDHTSIIQFLERWTSAIGQPALCPNISQWRRLVCGDLTRAFDFTSPVYGLPDLPTSTVISNPTGGGYEPAPTTNALPLQEQGAKPARPLPYQPNVNLDAVSLDDDGSIRAHLSMSNNGPLVAKASHFAIYNNAASSPPFADYPDSGPPQHTVGAVRDSPTRTVAATVDASGSAVLGAYDLTVIGPNRFLRRFTGNVATGDTASQAQADYYPDGLHKPPTLTFDLINDNAHAVTFTVHSVHYAAATTKVLVPAHRRKTCTLDPVTASLGWYDVTITLSADRSWSRRYVGHLENGYPSITGV